MGDKRFTSRKEGGAALIAHCNKIKIPRVSVSAGEYLGFQLLVNYDVFHYKTILEVKGALTHTIEMGSDSFGNIKKLDNLFEHMEKRKVECGVKLEDIEKQLENAQHEVSRPFEKEAELSEKLERLNELNALLNMDEKGSKTIETMEGDGTAEDKPKRKQSIRARLAELKEQIQGKTADICRKDPEKVESL